MSAMSARVLLLLLAARRARRDGRATIEQRRSLTTVVLGDLDATPPAEGAT